MINKQMMNKAKCLDVHILDEGERKIFAIVGYKVIFNKENNQLGCTCEGDSSWDLTTCAHRVALLLKLNILNKLGKKMSNWLDAQEN